MNIADIGILHVLAAVFGAALAAGLAAAVNRARRSRAGAERGPDGNSVSRSSGDRYAATFLASPDAAAITRLEDGRLIDVSDSYFRLTGYTRGEVIGKTTLELDIWVDPGQRNRFVELVRKTGECLNMEARFRSKDGRVVPSLISARTIKLGGEACIISLIRDITDRKQMEDQLRVAQKMEAMGVLAGGIAHDFNNLLTIIRGYCELMLRQIDEHDQSYRRILQIESAAERAASLTRQLLAFSRRQVMEPRVLDLNLLVVQMEKMIQRVLGEDIELSTRLKDALGNIRADPGQVEQVIMNLAVNARDAIARAGKVIIETLNVDTQRVHMNDLDISPGPYVVLSVTDTGEGMDEETRHRIFEPFFTTKPREKGTGLGLSTVYGIVKQSGGGITVYSEPGKGSTFRIYFPRVEEAPAAQESGPGVDAPPRGTETVLVVEDEEAVRTLITKALVLNGYHVLEAPNGEAALRLFGERTGEIDLVLTDVVMPLMNGFDLVKALSAGRDGPRALYMSGYAESKFTEGEMGSAGDNFIQKPFSPSELLRKVRMVLGER